MNRRIVSLLILVLLLADDVFLAIPFGYNPNIQFDSDTLSFDGFPSGTTNDNINDQQIVSQGDLISCSTVDGLSCYPTSGSAGGIATELVVALDYSDQFVETYNTLVPVSVSDLPDPGQNCVSQPDTETKTCLINVDVTITAQNTHQQTTFAMSLTNKIIPYFTGDLSSKSYDPVTGMSASSIGGSFSKFVSSQASERMNIPNKHHTSFAPTTCPLNGVAGANPAAGVTGVSQGDLQMMYWGADRSTNCIFSSPDCSDHDTCKTLYPGTIVETFYWNQKHDDDDSNLANDRTYPYFKIRKGVYALYGDGSTMAPQDSGITFWDGAFTNGNNGGVLSSAEVGFAGNEYISKQTYGLTNHDDDDENETNKITNNANNPLRLAWLGMSSSMSFMASGDYDCDEDNGVDARYSYGSLDCIFTTCNLQHPVMGNIMRVNHYYEGPLFGDDEGDDDSDNNLTDNNDNFYRSEVVNEFDAQKYNGGQYATVHVWYDDDDDDDDESHGQCDTSNSDGFGDDISGGIGCFYPDNGPATGFNYRANSPIFAVSTLPPYYTDRDAICTVLINSDGEFEYRDADGNLTLKDDDDDTHDDIYDNPTGLSAIDGQDDAGPNGGIGIFYDDDEDDDNDPARKSDDYDQVHYSDDNDDDDDGPTVGDDDDLGSQTNDDNPPYLDRDGDDDDEALDLNDDEGTNAQNSKNYGAGICKVGVEWNVDKLPVFKEKSRFGTIYSEGHDDDDYNGCYIDYTYDNNQKTYSNTLENKKYFVESARNPISHIHTSPFDDGDVELGVTIGPLARGNPMALGGLYSGLYYRSFPYTYVCIDDGDDFSPNGLKDGWENALYDNEEDFLSDRPPMYDDCGTSDGEVPDDLDVRNNLVGSKYRPGEINTVMWGIGWSLSLDPNPGVIDSGTGFPDYGKNIRLLNNILVDSDASVAGYDDDFNVFDLTTGYQTSIYAKGYTGSHVGVCEPRVCIADRDYTYFDWFQNSDARDEGHLDGITCIETFVDDEEVKQQCNVANPAYPDDDYCLADEDDCIVGTRTPGEDDDMNGPNASTVCVDDQGNSIPIAACTNSEGTPILQDYTQAPMSLCLLTDKDNVGTISVDNGNTAPILDDENQTLLKSTTYQRLSVSRTSRQFAQAGPYSSYLEFAKTSNEFNIVPITISTNKPFGLSPIPDETLYLSPVPTDKSDTSAFNTGSSVYAELGVKDFYMGISYVSMNGGIMCTNCTVHDGLKDADRFTTGIYGPERDTMNMAGIRTPDDIDYFDNFVSPYDRLDDTEMMVEQGLLYVKGAKQDNGHAAPIRLGDLPGYAPFPHVLKNLGDGVEPYAWWSYYDSIDSAYIHEKCGGLAQRGNTYANAANVQNSCNKPFGYCIPGYLDTQMILQQREFIMDNNVFLDTGESDYTGILRNNHNLANSGTSAMYERIMIGKIKARQPALTSTMYAWALYENPNHADGTNYAEQFYNLAKRWRLFPKYFLNGTVTDEGVVKPNCYLQENVMYCRGLIPYRQEFKLVLANAFLLQENVVVSSGEIESISACVVPYEGNGQIIANVLNTGSVEASYELEAQCSTDEVGVSITTVGSSIATIPANNAQQMAINILQYGYIYNGDDNTYYNEFGAPVRSTFSCILTLRPQDDDRIVLDTEEVDNCSVVDDGDAGVDISVISGGADICQEDPYNCLLGNSFNTYSTIDTEDSNSIIYITIALVLILVFLNIISCILIFNLDSVYRKYLNSKPLYV